ncbi:MAG: VCBS repeat-containing protein [Candidatus Zixiibacteriota bacterium]|nr:MAG: VCBS repeat-containing protein [candidate division Zixibacteria bacterium]
MVKTMTAAVLVLLVTGGALMSQPLFDTRLPHPVGYSAQAIVSDDFDDLPWFDVAVTCSETDEVIVVLGTSDGRFYNSGTYEVGLGGTGVSDEPWAIAAADLDGINGPDLAVANRSGPGSASISILFNNGDGTFADAVHYAAGSTCDYVSITSADVDGLNGIDLITTNSYDNTVCVMLNDGSGNFGTGVTYSTGNFPVAVCAIDVYGTGLSDLAVVNEADDNVLILSNNGDGTFSPGSYCPVGDSPRSIVSRDFDGDNSPDLAVGNYGSSQVSVLLNDGSGVFGAAVNYDVPVGPTHQSICAGPLDGDASRDLAVLGSTDSVYVLLNSGDGTFDGYTAYPAGDSTYAVVAMYFNMDFFEDLVVSSMSNAPGDSGYVSVLLNKEDEGFPLPAAYSVGGDPSTVIAVDLDGSDGLDLVTANPGSDNISALYNDGDGNYDNIVSYSAGDEPRSVAAGDFDSDNDYDVAVANFGSKTVTIYANNSGSLSLSGQLAFSNEPIAIESADFDDDGDDDLAVVCSLSNQVYVMICDGSLGFYDPISYGTGADPRAVHSADFDGVNGPDLAVANWGSNDVSVFLSNGDGSFSTAGNFPAGNNPISITSAMFDGDNDYDLAVASETDDSCAILWNDGYGNFSTCSFFSALWSGYTCVAAADVDGSDSPDLILSHRPLSAVTVMLNDGAGNMSDGSGALHFGTGMHPSCVVAADVDGDTDDDLVTVHPEEYRVCTFLNTTIEPCCELRGDVNHDGQIDVLDVTHLVFWIFKAGSPPPPCMDEADVDGNDVVNVLDAIYMVDFIFKLGPPPVPCP